MFLSKLFSRTHTSNQGFSLVEVLITSAIIGILTGVVLIRYNGFNSSVLLKNQAFELALAIREAQVFSVSIRGGESTFRDPYGIHVDLSSGSTVTYTLFLDNNGDELYDSADDTDVTETIIDSRFVISDLCVTSGGSETCVSDSGPGGPFNQLAVTFKRPNFDARIAVWKDPGGTFTRRDSARLVLESVDTSSIQRQVLINSTGQITVE